MLQNEKELLKRTNELLKENKELKKKIKCLKDEFLNTVVPFDYTGDQNDSILFKQYAEILIKKGYLTDQLKPTAVSLKKDFIRYNDGRAHFENVDRQPELLLTGRVILYLDAYIVRYTKALGKSINV